MTPATLRDYEPPFGTVVFDCDSTLSTIEGIDELCGIVGVAAGDVAELTTRAMAGELALRAVDDTNRAFEPRVGKLGRHVQFVPGPERQDKAGQPG